MVPVTRRDHARRHQRRRARLRPTLRCVHGGGVTDRLDVTERAAVTRAVDALRAVRSGSAPYLAKKALEHDRRAVCWALTHATDRLEGMVDATLHLAPHLTTSQADEALEQIRAAETAVREALELVRGRAAG